MESLKYLLTRLIRHNSGSTDDFDRCIGSISGSTTSATAKAVVGYGKGGSRYVGTRLVDYNRINLGVLFKNITPKAAMYRATNHREVFKTLLETYGLPGADEPSIINECASVAMDPNNPPANVTLTINAGALYSGTLTVTITLKRMALSDIVINRELAVMVPRLLLSDPKLVIERKYYHHDFSDAVNNATLRSATTSWSHGNYSSWFSDMINSADVRQECGNIWWGWGTTLTVEHNLNQMPCVYNGPTSGYPDANPRFARCAVFDQGRAYSSYDTNKGKFILHYN